MKSVYKDIMWKKYWVRVPDSELAIVHRVGRDGSNILAEHLQHHSGSSLYRIVRQKGGGNRNIKVP